MSAFPATMAKSMFLLTPASIQLISTNRTTTCHFKSKDLDSHCKDEMYFLFTA
jgi:hypothetical protein